jgi:hypothetical protein
MPDNPEVRHEILLETINPSDLTPEDLWELAESLSSLAPEIDFIPAYEDQYGAGVSWHEVLRIWVENEDIIKGGVFGLILQYASDAMRKRFKKPSGKHRPKTVAVSSKETRKELISIVIEAPDSQAVEVEINARLRSIPPKRPRKNG